MAFFRLNRLCNIYLTKCADADLELEDLVRAKREAPAAAQALDKIALMFNELDTMEVDNDDMEIHRDNLVKVVDIYDDLKDEIARVSSTFKDKPLVISFLKTVLMDSSGIVHDILDEAQATMPFGAIEEETQQGIATQLAGRSEKRLEYMREYSRARKAQRRQEYNRIKQEEPEIHNSLKEDVKNRVKKHRENMTDEQKAKKNKEYRENMTDEQKKLQAEKNKEYKKKRIQKLKELAGIK